jgi:tripeptide aminopeptidase
MIHVMKHNLKIILAALCINATTLVIAQEGNDTAAAKSFPIEPRYTKEITELAKKPVIVSAFKNIMQLEPETQQNLIILTEIPSPPFKEQKRGAKFLEMVKAIGADSVWMDAVGNVIAYKKGKSGKKKVVLEGHLDTVFPEGTDVTVKHKGDTLYAPGIGDNTRGLAVLLAVMKSMKQAQVKTDADIYYVGAVGEEGLGDLRGVKQLFKPGGLKIDSYIAIDGSGIGSITTGAVGSRRYHITFKGPGGHSYGAFGLANPHNASARAIYYFVKDADAYTRTSGPKTTYNVGVTGGGTSVNAIPFESWMEVDMRSESPERLNAVDAMLQAAVQKALVEENQMKRAGKDLTVEVKLVGDRPSGMQDGKLPLIQAAMASASFLGAAPKLSTSSTNSNIPIAKGVPAVTIGKGGSSGGAHSLNEWWVNEKGYLAIENALLILISEAGLAK